MLDKFESKNDYKNFLDYLKLNADKKRINDIEIYKKIINSAKNRETYCLSMAEIRKTAKIIAKNDLFGFLKIAKNDSFEETLIIGLVISYIKDLNLQIEYVDRWKDNIDSWAVCDSFCSSLKILKKSKNKSLYFDYFYNLCFSEKEFVSRLGIVSILSNYIEEEYFDRIMFMCENVKNDTYYSQMAIAWLLSVLFVKNRDIVFNLLKKRILPAFTQNKTISKCRDSFRVSQDDKEKLTMFRIKQ